MRSYSDEHEVGYFYPMDCLSTGRDSVEGLKFLVRRKFNAETFENDPGRISVLIQKRNPGIAMEARRAWMSGGRK